MNAVRLLQRVFKESAGRYAELIGPRRCLVRAVVWSAPLCACERRACELTNAGRSFF